MRDQFASEPDRFERFSLQLGDVLFDYSKNRINDDTLRNADLARACGVEGMRDRMFDGELIVHRTASRSACCTAQSGRRAGDCRRRRRDARGAQRAATRQQLTESIRTRQWRGAGSTDHRCRRYRHRRLYLGPLMATEPCAVFDPRPQDPLCVEYRREPHHQHA